MALMHEKHRKLAAMISDDLKREAREVVLLERLEHDYDFSVLANSIIDDLERLAGKYKAMLQEPVMDEQEVIETVQALLGQLPAGYPEGKLSKHTHGWILQIGSTLIFNGVSNETAIKETRDYIEARKRHPDLPVGVVHGLYD